MNVLSVLKSGGVYTPDYVYRLRDAVARNLSVDHDFVCLTDVVLTDCAHVTLKHDWPGWWAKLELFQFNEEPCLYFDLDTVIVNSIDNVAEFVINDLGNRFLMLRDFYRKANLGSGVMAWSGSYGWLYDNFNAIYGSSEVQQYRLIHNRKLYRGDQDWIANELRRRSCKIVAAQDVLQGVVSYKVDEKNNVHLSKDAAIVCFHGRPRPHEVQPPPQWMKENWYGELLPDIDAAD